MSTREAKRLTARLNLIVEQVEAYVSSYAFTLTDHDRVHQEHFRQQAQGWLKRLEAELAKPLPAGAPLRVAVTRRRSRR